MHVGRLVAHVQLLRHPAQAESLRGLLAQLLECSLEQAFVEALARPPRTPGRIDTVNHAEDHIT
ncbi:hypothetical protein G352_16444 [Rhodococcus ruber BKS 20-38]|uniref:Uncharacterized protein n=1 Tax=Rhodococcus ruber BKS 20-38 TaxID=1278076 RepID=M2XNC3_9NOCA|nr:hypothetical protein G352_16444 [Rhodococcus ruber BKS 20-38]